MLNVRTMALSCVCLLCAVTAQAAFDTAGYVPVTIQSILDGTGEYRVEDKVFSDWLVTTAGSQGTNAPEADEITVQGGVWDSGLYAGEIGLMFTGTWSAGSNDISTSVITVNVKADAPWLISDNTLYMDSFDSANGGEVTITENVYHDQPGAGVDSFVEKMVYSIRNPDGEGYKLQTKHVEYAPSDYTDDLWVVVGANAKGGNNANGVSSLSRFYVTFSQVPEPASMALLAVGAGVLALRRRRK